ncbi:TlpA family protein disulfide reductase [Vulgatibacter sp.]|uniref:TlpA family protein disulfide reductase n=1 Tax=Vulgatibacter sp. TaxID=1971226 RepID=UPI003567BDBB
MSDLIESKRGGPIEPPRLIAPLPSAGYVGNAGGWLTELPPDPPWLIGMWGASCWYCKKGLQDLVPLAAEAGVPFVALHVPEFPDDEEPGYPERVLEELGLPIGMPGVYHHRDAREWAEMVAMLHWPTFVVVDRDRRATFRLIGYAGKGDSMYGPLRAALDAARKGA